MLPRRNDFARMLLDRQLSGLPGAPLHCALCGVRGRLRRAERYRGFKRGCGGAACVAHLPAPLPPPLLALSAPPPLCGRVRLRRRHGDEQPQSDGHAGLCGRIQQGARVLERRRLRCRRRRHHRSCVASSHPPPRRPASLPLLPFCLILKPQVYFDSKLLAIADEDGYVSIVDTAGELPTGEAPHRICKFSTNSAQRCAGSRIFKQRHVVWHIFK